jgi:hypothetical protein
MYVVKKSICEYIVCTSCSENYLLNSSQDLQWYEL